MLYKLAHIIKDNVRFVWNMVEKVNSVCFAHIYSSKLKRIDDLLNNANSRFTVRQVNVQDARMLAEFFERQPEEAFYYFRPHEFDEISLTKILINKSFLMFVAMDAEVIVGYCFMRSFINGKTYKGYIVDSNHRGIGIAKTMGLAMNSVAEHLGLKMYKSISPNNRASMAVTKSVNDIRILNTLDNGDYLIECLPKNIK